MAMIPEEINLDTNLDEQTIASRPVDMPDMKQTKQTEVEDTAMIAEEINLDTNLDDQTIATRPLETTDLQTLGLTESLMLQAPQPRRNGYCIRLYLPATR